MICLPGQSEGHAAISFRVMQKDVVLMTTYKELMVILTKDLLILARKSTSKVTDFYI